MYLEFFKIIPAPIYDILNPIGLKYLTRLRVGLSHLRAHKHHHNFSDTPSKFCTCANIPEDVEHFLLHCPSYTNIRTVLFMELVKIISLVICINPTFTCNLLLYGNSNCDIVTNKKILNLLLILSFLVAVLIYH